MKNRRMIAASCLGLLLLASVLHLKENNMQRINFDLGENIPQTGKSSGVLRWATGDVAGIHQIRARYLRPDISAIYQRPGYEIAVAGLSALTLYADKNSNNGLAVESATRQFSSNAASSHDGQ